MPTRPLADEDLKHTLTHACEAFETLRNANLFLTGGTGFFGHWLVETLLYANRELDLNATATLLTRFAANFSARSPHIASNAAITLLEGDITSFHLPQQNYTHILHGATDSTGAQSQQTPQALAQSIVHGTQHLLDQLQQTQRLLYLSSGAVYGRNLTLPTIPETLPLPEQNTLPQNYDEAKRASEQLCLEQHENTTIARCFAFIGPHLPLDQHFSIGNFLGAALRNERIHIQSDGTPRRSWLYMADLGAWLWTILMHGQPQRAYNVGSDEAYTIAEAAKLAATTLSPSISIQIAGTPNPNAPLNSYVPNIDRARNELALEVRIPLAEALRRTANWHRQP